METFRPDRACGRGPHRRGPGCGQAGSVVAAECRHRVRPPRQSARREIPVAEIVTGIGDLNADRARIDVNVALPRRHAGVPSTPRFRDALENPAVLENQIMRRDRMTVTGGRVTQPVQCGGGIRHPGVVHQNHIRRAPRAPCAMIGRCLDGGHDRCVGRERRHHPPRFNHPTPAGTDRWVVATLCSPSHLADATARRAQKGAAQAACLLSGEARAGAAPNQTHAFSLTTMGSHVIPRNPIRGGRPNRSLRLAHRHRW
jgi:hypothetical protein